MHCLTLLAVSFVPSTLPQTYIAPPPHPRLEANSKINSPQLHPHALHSCLLRAWITLSVQPHEHVCHCTYFIDEETEDSGVSVNLHKIKPYIVK